MASQRVGHDWSDSARASGFAYSLSPPLFLSEFYLCFKALIGVSPATHPPTNHLSLSNAATLRQQHGLSLLFFFFFKSLLNFLQYCFCFMFFFFFGGGGYWGMWDISTPTREGTQHPCIGRWSPNHWTAREVPRPVFITKNLCFIQSEHKYLHFIIRQVPIPHLVVVWPWAKYASVPVL